MTWSSMDPGLRLAIGVLIVVQLTLVVIALVRLARTPDDRLAFLPRWGWVLAILLFQLVGSIVFLAVGRGPGRVDRPLPQERGDVVTGAMDTLYGDPPDAAGLAR